MSIKLPTGGAADYELGQYGISFKPVTADRLLHDGDTISPGNMQLVMLHHPGHTKGSCSFLFTVQDDQRPYKVLIANMPAIITERPFAAITTYPGIANDYGYTLKAMKNISFDIWLAAHAVPAWLPYWLAGVVASPYIPQRDPLV